MSNTLENVIWYSIGAFDYLLDREYHKGPRSLFKQYSSDRENILSNEDVDNINNQLKSFGYSAEELSNKRSEIKKNLQGRPIYQDHSDIDKKSVKHILNLYETGGCNSIDDFILDITRNVEDKSVVLNKKVLNKTLTDLASIFYVYLIDELDTEKTLNYEIQAIKILNTIIDLNEDNFYIVDDVKQKFYPLIRNLILKLYNEKEKKIKIIKFLKTFEILDLFTIFNWNLQLFPIELVEYLLEELKTDNKKDKWPVNRYHCLKMFLLENINPLHEEYLKLYEKYFNIDKDNAYLIMALRAHYNDDLSLCKKMINKINGDNLNDFYYNYFDDLEIAMNRANEKGYKTHKNKDEILSIVKADDSVKLGKYLRTFNNSRLSGYCLNECTRCLLSKKSYNVIEADLILYKNSTSLYSYLDRSSEYIAKEDIAPLYIFSTILLNLNLINESYILLKRIIEKVEFEDKKILDTLNFQLLITKKFLGYIV